MTGAVFRYLGFSVLGLLAAFALYIFGTILIYRQDVNDDLLSGKGDYLSGLAHAPAPSERPNIVIILFDDLGYGDLSSFGAEAIATPAIDELARNGAILTNYYSPSPVCTPSRAGLLTGRYPIRTTLRRAVYPEGSLFQMIDRFQGNGIRMPEDEVTIADALQAAGYRTAAIGKWHLGDVQPSRPNDFGFDYYYGPLYSNSMTPFEIYENDRVVLEAEIDQSQLSRTYAERAADFIRDADGEPFFVYLPHTFPHVPLYADPETAGQSRAGLYGDVVEDLDRSVAAVVDALVEEGVLDNTLIIVTSDNGPWFEGSPGNNRGRKMYTFEGGMHVPFIAHMPTRIPAGQSLNDLAIGMDLFTTSLTLAGLAIPEDRLIDGVDLMPVLQGQGGATHDSLVYWFQGRVKAVRDSRFKFLAEREHEVGEGMPFKLVRVMPDWLIDLDLDPHESYDVSGRYPEELDRLRAVATDFEAEVSANPRGLMPAQ